MARALLSERGVVPLILCLALKLRFSCDIGRGANLKSSWVLVGVAEFEPAPFVPNGVVVLRSLLPFCYPTAQYGAGQGSIKALACAR